MRIYIAHSKNMNYKEDLYNPLRSDEYFKNYELLLPHETNQDNVNSRDFYRTIDVFIADVSDVATGLGIELGWAYDDNKRIYCIYQKGKKISTSIQVLTNNFYEYSNKNELVKIVRDIIENEKKYMNVDNV